MNSRESESLAQGHKPASAGSVRSPAGGHNRGTFPASFQQDGCDLLAMLGRLGRCTLKEL